MAAYGIGLIHTVENNNKLPRVIQTMVTVRRVVIIAVQLCLTYPAPCHLLLRSQGEHRIPKELFLCVQLSRKKRPLFLLRVSYSLRLANHVCCAIFGCETPPHSANRVTIKNSVTQYSEVVCRVSCVKSILSLKKSCVKFKCSLFNAASSLKKNVGTIANILRTTRYNNVQQQTRSFIRYLLCTMQNMRR